SQAYLHAPSLVVDQLVDLGFAKRVGNRILTVPGHVVVPGPGYPWSPGDWGPLTDPENPESDHLAAAAGQVWLYVTGPVELKLGDPYRQDSGEAPGTAGWNRLNKTEVVEER